MTTSVRIRLTWLLFELVFLALVFCPTASAWQGTKRITLKNGLSVVGNLATLNSYVTDVSAPNPYSPDAPDNVVLVDDGMRRVFFNRDRIANGPVDVLLSQNLVFELTSQKKLALSETGAEGYAEQFLGVRPFDEHGHRELLVTYKGNTEAYVQGITAITPNTTTVETLKGRELGNRSWQMQLATNSIPQNVLSQVMHREITDPTNPTDYYRIFNIFVAARMYDAAQDQLMRIKEKFPDQGQEVLKRQQEMRSVQSDQLLEEIRNRRDAGQPKLVRSIAGKVTENELGEESRIAFEELRAELEKESVNIDELRKTLNQYVKQHLEQLANAEQQKDLREFLNLVEQNLSVANYQRFDGFVRLLSDQTISVEQRVAQILSGWYLGSSQTMDNYAEAESLIPVYGLVRRYLDPKSTPVERAQFLADIKKYEGGAPEYVAAMLAQMPPVHPVDLVSYTGEKPLPLSIDLPDFKSSQVGPLTCTGYVHLPPEYDPYRKYPLLVVLPSYGNAEQHLSFWCGDFDPKLKMRTGMAARFGYITVAIDWKLPGQTSYGYSAREHLACLKTIRQCLRQFSVDSDRVFLAGHGIGAEAAYDIGISHPDTFAGVVSFSGPSTRYSEFYKENKHLGLAIYAVVGDKDRGTTMTSEKSWNAWLQQKRSSFDLLLVEYAGRLGESFYEELPKVFEWMATQTRKLPNQNDDIEVSCKTLRPWTCKYWFVEYSNLPEENMVPPEFWIASGYNPLKIEFQKKRNRIFDLGPSKLGHVTISLSPEFVDLSQEIEIKGRGDFSKFVSPSLRIMLEDVRTRADQQHPYWARVKNEGKKWFVEE
jgi:pimeloyl-ACP methyl ester carboxylesterase